MSKAMIPIWLLSWAVLLPVDSVHTGTAGKTGLDRFTFGNIARKDHHRLWAHLILDYLFIGEDSIGDANNRLDHLSHVGRNEALAGDSTKIPHQSRPLENPSSKYGVSDGDWQGIYG
jgi:hypothetical protein